MASGCAAMVKPAAGLGPALGTGRRASILQMPAQPGIAQVPLTVSRRHGLGAVLGPRRRVVTQVLEPALLDAVVQHLPLAQVASPCNLMSCGDLMHRSTLDLVLRGEQTGPDWRFYLLLATVASYLFAAPGVLPGAFDYYVLAKLRNRNAYGKDDVVIGRKLATGGFGTVFLGDMKMEDGTKIPVIVKKAKEFGQAEAWMNERMMRLPGKHAAEFITAFDETLTLRVPAAGAARKAGAPMSDAVWLVWKYEGDNTLFDLMEAKDFPYNMEPLLLDRELRLPKGPSRKVVTIRLVLLQLLQALEAAHSTGIVHRDVKPQNCIFSEGDKKIKLIDLGAAADLRVGINYAPSEYLLDPRYAPPQQYVMSTQTPTPPPAPVAAFLSPVLWRMETPDRFDMWSCGVTLLQMCFPSLRNDNAICAFNERLQTLRYDLNAWRKEEEGRKGGMKPDMAEGFAILDLDQGAGWKLLLDLMAYKPADRLSASEALLSPFFTNSGLTSPSGTSALAALLPSLVSSANKAVSRALTNEVLSGFASSATGEDRGSLTEAQLKQELGLEEPAPEAPRRASNTIAWWQERQSEMRKSIERREGSQATSGLPMKGSRGVGGSRNLGGSGNVRAGTPAPPRIIGRSTPIAVDPAPAKPAAGGAFAGLLGGLTKGLSGGNGKANGNGNGNGNVENRPAPAGKNGNGNGNGNGRAGAARNGGGKASYVNGSGNGENGRTGAEEKEVELVGAIKGFDLLGLLKSTGNKK